MTATVGKSCRTKATCTQDLHVNTHFELKQTVAARWEEDLEDWGCAILPGHVHNYGDDGEEVPMSQRVHHRARKISPTKPSPTKASSPTEPDTAVKKVVFADTVKPSPEDEKREAEEKALKNERVEGKEGAAAVESPSSAAEQHQDSSTNAHHQHPAGMTRLAIQMQEINEQAERQQQAKGVPPPPDFPIWREYGQLLHGESMRGEPDKNQGASVFGSRGSSGGGSGGGSGGSFRGDMRSKSDADDEDENCDRGGGCNFFGGSPRRGSGEGTASQRSSVWKSMSDWWGNPRGGGGGPPRGRWS